MSTTSMPFTSELIFDELEIRDTDNHDSDVLDFTESSIGTIYISNTLDQSVDITIYGNVSESMNGAVKMGTSFNVSSGGETEARFLDPTSTGWLPYIIVRVSCESSPSDGSLTGYFLSKNFSNPK
ncbi:MAG: hypothetical protein ACOCQD_00010 [archaeon]